MEKRRRGSFLPLIFGVFFLLPFRLFAGDIAGFFFASPAQYAVQEREPATVQSRDASGATVKVPQTVCLEFRTDSPSGLFFENQAEAEGNNALVVTMNKNTANRTVYYRDTTPRATSLSLHAVLRPEGERPCKEWPISEWGAGWNATHEIKVVPAGVVPPVSDNSSSVADTPPPPPLVSGRGGGNTAVELEPSVVASAKIPQTAVVGAEVFLEAEAFGTKREPIQNARFIWSFGDGAVGEGKRVAHAYHYPGEYVVVVEAASGEKSASARGVISVAPAALSIGKVTPGGEGVVEIQNSGAVEVNLSRWRVRSNGSEFFIPEHTIILPKKILAFSGAVMKLIISPPDTALLYPNGSIAAVYLPQVAPPAPPEPVPFLPPASQAAASPVSSMVPARGGANTGGTSRGASHAVLAPSETQNIGIAPNISSRVSVSGSAATESLRLGAAASAGKSSVPWAVAAASLTALAVAGFLWRGRVVQKPLTEAEKLSREAEQYDIVE